MIPQCVTNVLRDFMPCLTDGEHLEDCESDICEGCLPAEPVKYRGKHTHVCELHWLQIEQALTDWETWYPMLGTEARAVSPTGEGHTPAGPRFPLPPLQADIDRILRYRQDTPTTLGEWVSTVEGATAALRFVRAVKFVLPRYPFAEASVKLRDARCPKCGLQGSVVRFPPATADSDVIYRCSLCHHHLDDREIRRVEWAQLRPCCRQCASEHGCLDPNHRCHKLTVIEPWQSTTHATDEEPFDRRDESHLTAVREAPFPVKADLVLRGRITFNEIDGGDAA